MSLEQKTFRGDLISVIEAAYAQTAVELDWLQGIANAALPCLEHGLGLNAYTYDATDPSDFRVPACAGAGPTPMDRPRIETLVRSASPELIAYSYTPGPPMYFSRLSVDLAKQGIADAEQTKERMSKHRVADVFAVRGSDPTMRGVLITVNCAKSGRVAPSHHRVLACLGAHLASGWRLRQARAEIDQTDAVLDGKGRYLHLGDGEPRAKQQHIDRAFRVRTHARGGLRKQDSMAAMELWRAMVQGEWTLVDHVDTDGKRFILARRNSQTVPEIGALARRERQVAAYAAFGFSLKEIGYELGLGVPTVSVHLKHALRKLRLKNRGELVSVIGRSR